MDDGGDGGSEFDFGMDESDFGGLDDSGVSYDPYGDDQGTDTTITDENGNPISADDTNDDYPDQEGDDSSQSVSINSAARGQQSSSGGGSGSSSKPFTTAKPASAPRAPARNPYGNLAPNPRSTNPVAVVIPIGDRTALPRNGLAPIYRTSDRGVYDPSANYASAFYGPRGGSNANTGRAVSGSSVLGGGLNQQALMIAGLVVIVALVLTRA